MSHTCVCVGRSPIIKPCSESYFKLQIFFLLISSVCFLINIELNTCKILLVLTHQKIFFTQWTAPKKKSTNCIDSNKLLLALILLFSSYSILNKSLHYVNSTFTVYFNLFTLICFYLNSIMLNLLLSLFSELIQQLISLIPILLLFFKSILYITVG